MNKKILILQKKKFSNASKNLKTMVAVDKAGIEKYKKQVCLYSINKIGKIEGHKGRTPKNLMNINKKLKS